MPRNNVTIRDFPGKRWLNVGLRSLHLIGIVLFGAALLGAGSIAWSAGVVVVSGGLMFAIDTWAHPGQLREVSGFGVVIKLLLVGLVAWLPDLALPLFWTLLILSTLLSHAPGSLRHRRLF
ncbi:MAG: hypothetical protein CVU34_04245 [Betaproteobacteria bacterium HGW-Betaproteobacteria-7]|jgi:hypothetical protein|nr:MAG: hypothetical protein CVU34_04245 [Betaproteobacteria bacterium HGW-Betaproteobacteria-7]